MFSAGPIAETEAAILAAVERDLLDGGIFEDALSLAVERLSRETPQAGLVAERDRLAQEIGHLVDAVSRGGDVPSLVSELRTRETRKAELDRTLNRPTVSLDALRARLGEKLADWRRLLRSRPTHGQKVLRTLLDGPIRVGLPSADGVPWEARGSLHAILGTLSYQVASPSGFADRYSRRVRLPRAAKGSAPGRLGETKPGLPDAAGPAAPRGGSMGRRSGTARMEFPRFMEHHAPDPRVQREAPRNTPSRRGARPAQRLRSEVRSWAVLLASPGRWSRLPWWRAPLPWA